MSAFENFSREEGVRASSNRTLGVTLGIFFALIAFAPALRGHSVRWWAAAVSGAFLIAAAAIPAILGPVNRAWTGLAVILHKVTNPIILGIVFYGVFTPFGWLLRRMGKDYLRLRRSGGESYWVLRDPAGPAPETMTNQF